MLLASGLWSSAKSYRSQDASAMPLATTRYSASALERENRLPLGRSGDKVATQKDGIAGSGAASVRTASPVSVGVDNQLSRGRGRLASVKDQAEAHSATNVAEETLQRSKV